MIVEPQTEPLISSESTQNRSSPRNLSKPILIGILVFVLLSLIAYGAYWYGQSVMMAKTTPSTASSIPSESSQPKNSFYDINNQATPALTDETAKRLRPSLVFTKHRFDLVNGL